MPRRPGTAWRTRRHGGVFTPALWCALAGLASAQPLDDAPVASQRVVRVFDFEEQDFNAEEVPQYWVRAQHNPPARDRPGFPAWNKASFDESRAFSGQFSVKVPTEGGSASLRLSPGVIAAIPGADYVVTARIQTEGLSRSGARLVARFLDDRRQPIPGGEASTRVVRSSGEWAFVQAELRGVHERAAWIQIDLELLQPRELDRARRRELGHEAPREDDPVFANRVWHEDVRGAAWFDDVVVNQLPRVELATASRANILSAPETPVIQARVRDLTGESLRATMTVYDMEGARVATMRKTLSPGGEAFSWSPTLPGFGWGRAVLELHAGDGELVARSYLDFLWTPPTLRSRGPEAERFSLIAEQVPREQLDALPELASRVGVGAVQMAVLDRSITSYEVRSFARRIDPIVQSLLDRGIHLTFTVTGVPDELAEILQIDVREPMELLGWTTPLGAVPPWTLYLNAILDRFGQRVSRWQVGRTGEAYPFWRPKLAGELESVRRELGRLVPSVEVAVPWRAEQSIDDRIAGRGAVTVTLPPSVRLEAVEEYVRYWGRRVEATMVIEPPDAAVYGRRAGVIELVKRAAYAWKAGAQRIAIDANWTTREGVGRHASTSAAPEPTLAAWRQIVERLGGRRIVADLPVADGMTAMILKSATTSAREGALLAWNDAAPEASAVIRTYLGADPVRVIDPFGNTRTVGLVDGVHTIPLTETPVFIEGVDVDLALFRAGFAIDPPFIPAEATVHQVDVVLRNPFPAGISGRLRIAEPAPDRWKIEPRLFAFNIPPGGEQRLPVELSFGLAEEAGLRTVVAEVELNAIREYPVLRVSAPLEIGLSTLQMTPTYSFVRNEAGEPTDLLITVSIVNQGDRAATLRAFAVAPGYAREQAPVSALGPGQSTVLRFTYRDGAARLRGQRVRVGLIEIDGAGRLNKSVTIE
ncbi:MAG: hypothetical protein KF684_12295 [Phycisphaeraceae bacterium]|nr:hypothetical protein [Phycisphaeraceae bacterium]